MYPEASLRERTIRVFISSTFRDMHAEREELVKRVFPQLRRICEERNVTWGEVDLRWGITKEEAERGEVLPICLAEIARCQPYFVGLLGERYGWVPESIDEELTKSYQWLADYSRSSVTEMEIIYGAILNPEMAEQAFFYFRDPSYIDSIDKELEHLFREIPNPEEIETLSPAEATRRANERKEKLANLKATIRRSGFPLRENYQTPQELGEWVLRDMISVIDRLYPPPEIINPLEKEASGHDAFVARLAKVYIQREQYFARLNEYVKEDSPPLVVLGESGVGKSALLANWVRLYGGTPVSLANSPRLISHFIGSTSQSSDWVLMLKRIIQEINRLFNLQVEIPDSFDALRTVFTDSLAKAGSSGRLVLVIDGLDKLADYEKALDLIWLPNRFPSNLRLIVSTLPGRTLDALSKRGWPTLDVEPLVPNESARLIKERLAQYSKKLGEEHIERITKASQTANPLYLNTLIEELRLYGDHETLHSRIEFYLAAPTVEKLYDKIIERYESDYELAQPGLVREATSLLWAAREGLSEAEMLELLGSADQPLPHIYWSPFYLAAEQLLVSRSGLLTFSNEYLRKAVKTRFLPDEQDERMAHQRLADYLQAKDYGVSREHAYATTLQDRWREDVSEFFWQVYKAQAWQQLYDLLTNWASLALAWLMDPTEILRYWREIEAHTNLSMIDAYRPVIQEPVQHGNQRKIAQLLALSGHVEEALQLQRALIELYRLPPDEFHAISVGVEIDIDEDLLHSGIDFREALYKNTLANVLIEHSEILQQSGDLPGALATEQEVEHVFSSINSFEGMIFSRARQNAILLELDDLQKSKDSG